MNNLPQPNNYIRSRHDQPIIDGCIVRQWYEDSSEQYGGAWHYSVAITHNGIFQLISYPEQLITPEDIIKNDAYDSVEPVCYDAHRLEIVRVPKHEDALEYLLETVSALNDIRPHYPKGSTVSLHKWGQFTVIDEHPSMPGVLVCHNGAGVEISIPVCDIHFSLDDLEHAKLRMEETPEAAPTDTQ